MRKEKPKISEYEQKKVEWELIFELGKSRNMSKKQCQEKITAILSRLPAKDRGTLAALSKAYFIFKSSEKPLWMESVDDIVEWKKRAEKRVKDRDADIAQVLDSVMVLVAKIRKGNSKDVRWIQTLETEISRRTGFNPNSNQNRPFTMYKMGAIDDMVRSLIPGPNGEVIKINQGE